MGLFGRRMGDARVRNYIDRPKRDYVDGPGGK